MTPSLPANWRRSASKLPWQRIGLIDNVRYDRGGWTAT